MLKIYIMAGQSNVVGHAKLHTFPYVGMDPKTRPLLEKVQNPDLTFKTFDNVWISALTRLGPRAERCGNLTVGFGANENKIGPELMFGVTMEELHESNHNPILIVKTAWGGKTLHTDFRPPSAGKESDESGFYYDKMMEQIRRVLADIARVVPSYTEDQGYQVGGFLWFQGWNDLIDQKRYPHRDKPGGYDEYGQLLSMFIQDVRKDLSLPDLPFLIGVAGQGGPDAGVYAENFRNAQEMPVKQDKLDRVAAVRTEQLFDPTLSELNEKLAKFDNKIKQYRKKHPEMTDEEAAKQLREWQLERCTQEEIDLYDMALSDGGCHYFGSAKFFLQAGKLFAERLFELENGKAASDEL